MFIKEITKYFTSCLLKKKNTLPVNLIKNSILLKGFRCANIIVKKHNYL